MNRRDSRHRSGVVFHCGVAFHQGCPVCGRRLEIDVALLGAKVYCQHCGGRFIAMDESLGVRADAAVADRADELLAQAATLLARHDVDC